MHSTARGLAWPLIDAEGQHQRVCGKGEGAEASAGMGAQCRGFCLVATDPPDSCEVEAMAELMTVRLAELVNARVGTYRLDLCLWSRRACL